jgi:prepilin-type N-terminal cleavage/methylation domain-containing protein
MKQRGFTLIEMMIAVVIGLTVLLMIAGAISGHGSGSSNSISWGINGMTESRCIEGYKFIVGQEGQARQILDEFGKGVRCYPNPEPGKPGSFGVN